MTIEERNIKLKHLITCMKCETSGKVCDENCSTQYEAGNMGEIISNLKAVSEILEQQPCGDAVSRQVVHDLIAELLSDYLHDEDREKIEELDVKIEDLEPVIPKEKTGHWIRVTDKSEHLVWECNKCGWQQRFNTKYCPNCGKRMVSE